MSAEGQEIIQLHKDIQQLQKDKALIKYINLIHFGLTSEDVNSLSYAIIIKNGIDIHLKRINTINKYIKSLSKKWLNIPLLSRTHGQAASPTRMGKEMMVFVERLKNQLLLMNKIPHTAKLLASIYKETIAICESPPPFGSTATNIYCGVFAGV